MMNYTAYSGNWIVCGSYALIHAANLSYTDLIPLENSTGSSFGISCLGETYGYTRLLTVFRDFNYGIDTAAPLWGIQMRRIDGATKDAIADLLEEQDVERIVIGPISMVGLTYLPLSQQYKHADHFIACIRKGKNIWHLIDSEGMPGMLADKQQIVKMLSIKNIPEACDKYTARIVLQANSHNTANDRAIRIRHTLKTAYANLKDAQESGQGYNSLYRCAELIRDMPSGKLDVLLYGVDYLIQRKIMLLKLLQEAKEEKVAIVNPHIITEAIKFIEAAGALRRNINSKCVATQDHLFCRLGEAENCITERWKEWIQLW